MSVDPSKSLFVVLGNQLFPPRLLGDDRKCRFFMAEDAGLCTYVRHHKQKIAMFLAAMRAYRDELQARGMAVHYECLSETEDEIGGEYESKLERQVRSRKVEHLVMWEIEDKFFETRMRDFAAAHDLTLTFRPSPMFLTGRNEFAEWLQDRRPHMATFYQWQRKRLNVLMTPDGDPEGGRWSFDDENRRALPRAQSLPPARWARPDRHVRDVIPIVERRFADHPGAVSEEDWWLPTSRRQTLDGFRRFLDERFELFGPYEDALSTRDSVLFHSVLSPALNMGLVTPREILDRTLKHTRENRVPLNSLEGFVRQVIGWREFVRGIYQHYSERQESENFFGHSRRLRPCWFNGTTGLKPLDDVIDKALRLGWTHHIERLMIAGNLMTLCEIDPREAYRWFMELFVDSSDWVMVPNVYGMGIFSDGGIFSTKPYICGSNYILKMSDYARPKPGGTSGNESDAWCDEMDGLYWRFIDKHRAFFRGQARMAQMVGTLDRIDSARRKHLFRLAEKCIRRITIESGT